MLGAKERANASLLNIRLLSPNIQGTMTGMIRRRHEEGTLKRLLRQSPVAAILGARQVGKSTLARQVADQIRGPVAYFDLENPDDEARLREPMLALQGLRGLVI